MHVKSIALLALVVSGCTGDSVTIHNSPLTEAPSAVLPAADIPSEKLDAQYDNGQIIAHVISTGCTRADHFSVSHRGSENSCLLLVLRDSPDFCKRASFVVELEIDWPLPEACHGRKIVFANQQLTDD